MVVEEEEGAGEQVVEEGAGKDLHPHLHLDHHLPELDMVRHLWVDLDLDRDRGMEALHLWVVVVVVHQLEVDGWILGCYRLESIYLGVRKLWTRSQRRWRKFLPDNCRMLWLE